ncbi:hypothetical protein STVIR_6385 [Streptomyces viridochromogenes Tue57]|uniref:Uncharacterized protein n=1 Tax=Streptomyces viridochromogenes Tue57 TaxID=1160705 RepID=L8P8F5_STRVR|nr:hypothetical protein STVIR_6385 [Streptomyces viridochromogenes Tue57]
MVTTRTLSVLRLAGTGKIRARRVMRDTFFDFSSN